MQVSMRRGWERSAIMDWCSHSTQVPFNPHPSPFLGTDTVNSSSSPLLDVDVGRVEEEWFSLSLSEHQYSCNAGNTLHMLPPSTISMTIRNTSLVKPSKLSARHPLITLPYRSYNLNRIGSIIIALDLRRSTVRIHL